ncbi:adenosylmethionine decarboxylase [Vagococcus fluvialis]|uniref:adenosylmethionine decarboxylase n=1 Tax=Vagococcus fluvialis TaxID=2738 RepID=UPI00288D161E|nr:adenosylmethionine decarboxylase [Vagococcus fluvialis]MDT2746363.1 adenosylmethionine decarboxylase [Vagococcus fluvialis]
MNVLEKIKNDIGLNQSIECLEIGLVYSYLYKTIATKELAKKMSVPVPIATAFKKELVKNGWMKRESFYFLTAKGQAFVDSQFNYKQLDKEMYKIILTKPHERLKFLEQVADSLKQIFEERPAVKRELDQAHATTETVIKRVEMMLVDPLIFSKKIAFVGDDDLVSLFLSVTLEKIGFKNTDFLTAYDIDTELLAFIEEKQSKEVPIRCVKKDFRNEKTTDLIKVDVVFTDPPYTPDGILTFINFGEKLLNKYGKMYVSFNYKTPEIQSFLQKEINLKGLNFIEITPNFNTYLGGSIIGNVSNLYVLQKSEMTETMKSSENIYTKSLKKNKTSKRLGFHSLYDLKECNSEVLTSVDNVRDKMNHMSQLFKLNVVEEKFHQFKPYGVSGVMVLKESHFTIHTWPEHNYAAVDLFICEETVDESKFMEELQNVFGSKRCELKKIYRVN